MEEQPVFDHINHNKPKYFFKVTACSFPDVKNHAQHE